MSPHGDGGRVRQALRAGSLRHDVPSGLVLGVESVPDGLAGGLLDNFTGCAAEGSNRVAKALDTASRVGEYVWPTVLVGCVTIGLIVVLERTSLGALGMVVAIVTGSGLVELLGLQDVAQLRDITEMSGSLPAPTLPDLDLVLTLVIPALSLAFVGLVLGAAISSSVPNSDGNYPDASGDFRGKGVANLGSGLFLGMPVGGSMSATSIVTTSGARSRVALLVAAATMAITIVLFADLVGDIAMPALAGLLIVVGIKTCKADNVTMVVRTGCIQATVMGVTFALTMVIPLQYAVLIGVGLSIILYVARQSQRIRIRRWTFVEDGTVTETDPPVELLSRQVVVLRPYGSLFFAAAGMFSDALPRVTDTSRFSVVVISLRGKEDLGSTFINVVTRCAQRLRDAEGVLMLADVSDGVAGQMEKTGAISILAGDDVFHATLAVTESTRQAMAAAQRVVSHMSNTPADDVDHDERRPRPQVDGDSSGRRGEQS